MEESQCFQIWDKCRANYLPDNLFYEAIITNIEVDANGSEYASIIFLGYENEQQDYIEELRPSFYPPTDSSSVTRHWQIGDTCMAVYSQDGYLYKARIENFKEDKYGNKSAYVFFVDFDYRDHVWLDGIFAVSENKEKSSIELAPCEKEEKSLGGLSPIEEEVQTELKDSTISSEISGREGVWKLGMLCRAFHPTKGKELSGCIIKKFLKTDDGEDYVILGHSDEADFSSWTEDIFPNSCKDASVCSHLSSNVNPSMNLEGASSNAEIETFDGFTRSTSNGETSPNIIGLRSSQRDEAKSVLGLHQNEIMVPEKKEKSEFNKEVTSVVDREISPMVALSEDGKSNVATNCLDGVILVDRETSPMVAFSEDGKSSAATNCHDSKHHLHEVVIEHLLGQINTLRLENNQLKALVTHQMHKTQALSMVAQGLRELVSRFEGIINF